MKHTPSQSGQDVSRNHMSNNKELERPYFPEIEKLFSEYVEYYGGTVIDKLAENKVDRKNADYLFENPQIIAELKTFEKDIFSGQEEFTRVEKLYKKWLEEGMMTEKDFGDYAFRRKPLPKKCNEDLIERASRTIERAIHKADKQIEESKKTFNKEKANGIVFLINDANYFFSTEGFLAVIANLIGRKFKESSFDVIIYLTINQATRKENSELDYNVWIPIYTKVDKAGETIVSDELYVFVNDFGEKLQTEFLPLKTGQELKELTQIKSLEESAEELKKHKFIPKDIIYIK
jgi:hypothetical protein